MPTSPTAPASAVDTRSLRAARDAAVLCELAPLSVLAIDGADAAAFLNGQLSTEVSKLDGRTCHYTTWSSPAGRVLANLFLWRTAPEGGFCALISGDLAEPIRKRLTMFILRSKVSVADATSSFARFGVGGPHAHEVIRAALGAVPALYQIERSGDALLLGIPGMRFLVLTPHDQAAAMASRLESHAQRADFEAWRWLTIHAGVPVITAATQDKFVPQMLNMDVLGAIDFSKGCYTGQEIIARTQYLGRLKERLYAFAAPTDAIAAGDRLFSREFGDQPCGTVVNSALAPDAGSELLAVVQMAAIGNPIHLRAPDGLELVPLALPYELPTASPQRGRIA